MITTARHAPGLACTSKTTTPVRFHPLPMASHRSLHHTPELRTTHQNVACTSATKSPHRRLHHHLVHQTSSLHHLIEPPTVPPLSIKDVPELARPAFKDDENEHQTSTPMLKHRPTRSRFPCTNYQRKCELQPAADATSTFALHTRITHHSPERRLHQRSPARQRDTLRAFRLPDLCRRFTSRRSGTTRFVFSYLKTNLVPGNPAEFDCTTSLR